MDYEIKDVLTPNNYFGALDNEIKCAPKSFKELKNKANGALLLIRCGDFYESYCEDAQVLHEVLNLAITCKKYRIAGFPHHSLDIYLPKLIRAGYRIAICDQLHEK